MATAAVDRFQSPPLAWSTSMPSMHTFNSPGNQNLELQGRQRSQYGSIYASQPYGQNPGPAAGAGAFNNPSRTVAPIPARNTTEMTREKLIQVLEHFSSLLPHFFGMGSSQTQPSSAPPCLRFVVHGGACMLLHPGLHALSRQQEQPRTTTRDVDYIHRGFMAEYGHISGAAQRLQDCIRATAGQFNLGADWMNSDADVALPMVQNPSDPRSMHDPIYTASTGEPNIALHTIFRSTNGLLHLISVAPYWAVCLKLVRYTNRDPGDISLLLRYGTQLSGTYWTAETLQSWLETECWAMGYASFDPRKKAEMRGRIEHAIQALADWPMYASSGSSPNGSNRELGERRHRDRKRSEYPPVSAHDAMGGGSAVVGGAAAAAAQHGWGTSFGPWDPQQQQQQPGQANGSSAYTNSLAHAHGAPYGATRPHESLHVTNWGPSTRERSQSRPPSSRGRSKSRSRPPSPSENQEPFIPPGAEDLNIDDIDAAAFYGYDPARDYDAWSSGHGSARSARSSRSRPHGAQNPNPSAHAHALANGNGNGNGAWNEHTLPYLPGVPAGVDKVVRTDPFTMDELNRAVGTVAQGTSYDHHPGPGPSQMQRRTASSGGGGGGTPFIPPPIEQLARKRKDKQRQKERDRARGSKWGPQYGSDDETDSESDSDEDEGDKENWDWQGRGRRDNREASSSKRMAQAPWHGMYAPAGNARAGPGGQQQPDNYHEYQAHQMERQTRGRSASRAASRTRSNDGRSASKHRPPPLDLTAPVIPGETAAMLAHQQSMAGARPSRSVSESMMHPSELAQLQFERQRQEWETDLPRQRVRTEREQAFYRPPPAHLLIEHQQRQQHQRQLQQYQQQQQQQQQYQPYPPQMFQPPQYPYQQQQMLQPMHQPMHIGYR